MPTKTYEDNGCRVVEDLVPEGHTVVDTYNPCSTVTPWDYYGGKHMREYVMVLQAAGLHPVPLVVHRTLLHPHGTGPRGSVRMGDAMTPGTFKVAVPSDEENAAVVAIAAHKEAINQWLQHEGKMPAACQG